MSQTITSMIRVGRQYVTDDNSDDKGWGDGTSQTITSMIRGGETICYRR